MFEFFEELIGELGVKLISDFTEKIYNWIIDVKNNSKEETNDNSRNLAQIGSSGNFAQIGSSRNLAKIGSSGYGAQIGSSGDDAQIGSSGNFAQIGSSGYGAQIGSNGDRAQIGSSGDDAQIGSSGNLVKIGSSGYGAQIGSNGDRAQIGSSGYGAQIGSNGDRAQIGSSGNLAKIGSSGYGAQIGSNGDDAQIGSSGNLAKIGSSGYGAQIDIKGENSIGFACGYNAIIKAKKGTWISLAEYGKDDDGNIIPIYAKSAQIGNKEYKDHKGRILKSTVYYTLWHKEFYEVDIFDGIKTIKISEKKKENITIIKGIDIDTILDDKVKEIYIAKENKLTAHGYTLREAIEDLTLKKLDNVNVNEIVKKIKETGRVTRSQYRAITGACSYGTNKFCEEHNIQDLDEIELTELRKILINDYGAEKFWNLIDKN